MGYNVSDANSYLVITGGGIPDVKICKKAWVWTWQKVRDPQSYQMLCFLGQSERTVAHHLDLDLKAHEIYESLHYHGPLSFSGCAFRSAFTSQATRLH